MLDIPLLQKRIQSMEAYAQTQVGDEDPTMLEMAQAQLRRLRAQLEAEEHSRLTRVSLPLIEEGEVAVPTVFLRSSLFGVWSASKTMQPLTPREVPCEDGFSVIAGGSPLWQKDLLLMAVLLRLAGADLSTPATIPLHQLLKQMGFGAGKSNYAALTDSLTRLSTVRLLILDTDGAVVFDGNPIRHRIENAASGQLLYVEVNLQWAALFGENQWTRLPFQGLRDLGRKELAIWLAGYLLTRTGKQAIPLRQLYELSGLTTELRFFRRAVCEALAEAAFKAVVPEAVLVDDVLVAKVRRARPASSVH